MGLSERRNLNKESDVKESGNAAASRSHCALESCSHSAGFRQDSGVPNTGAS